MNEDRSKVYKYDTKDKELRKRREDEGVQLRKVKREQQLSKRRNYSSEHNPLVEETTLNYNELIERLPHHVDIIQNGELENVIESIVFCRRLLSQEPYPPITEIFDSGIVPNLIQFLSHFDNPQLQFEATWALTNMASGTNQQTFKLVNLQIIPALMKLLSSEAIYVVEQAIWALGNIGGDCSKFRDHLLNLDLMPFLIRIISERTGSDSFLRNTVWCISNLCRGKNPKPDFEMVKLSLPLLSSLLNTKDTNMLIDICWALSYMTDGDCKRIQTVLDCGVVKPLVKLLCHDNYSVVSAVLRSVGNILTGNDLQTQLILDAGILDNLSFLMGPKFIHLSVNIRKEICWTLSNIAAGSRLQIQALLDSEILPSLIRILSNSEMSVKKEAAWTLANALSGGDTYQINRIVQMDCIEPLCKLLTVIEPKIIMIALTALERILKGGKIIAHINNTMNNPFIVLIEECSGQDKIEHLQNHENEEIYKKSFLLMDKYFAEQEDVIPALIPNINKDTGLYECTDDINMIFTL